MTIPKRYRIASVLLAVLLLVGCGNDSGNGTPTGGQVPTALPATETWQDFGDYVVHFRALNTDELSPEIASSYGITRSRSRAMLNVSVLRKEDGSPGRPVHGSVTAVASSLTGQERSISMREIDEGDAVYYIGELPVTNQETLVFSIEVVPSGETSRFSVRFRQQFFTD